jgi:hypothetical protein
MKTIRRGAQRAELGRPKTPEPTGLGMTHPHHASPDEDDDPPARSINDLLSQNPSVFDQLFWRLNTLDPI